MVRRGSGQPCANFCREHAQQTTTAVQSEAVVSAEVPPGQEWSSLRRARTRRDRACMLVMAKHHLIER